MDDKSPLKILIVEDVEPDVELAVRELKKSKLNFIYKQVGTKEAFSKALDEFRPDVILSDYSLPDFTGLDAFLLVKQKYLRVPFLLVTGALPEPTVIEIVKSGIDDYILKDNLQRLPSALKNAYSKSRTEARNDELNGLREKFIAIMSHQLRTPLTVVNWQLEHLLSGEAGELKTSQQEVLRVAHNASRNLVARINDLLMVIDIEEGQVHLNKQKISLDNLWKSVMVSWKKACKGKNIECAYIEPVEPLGTVLADPDKIRIVFEKLADNSVMYTPEHHKITATLKKVGAAVRFEIADTGVGVPESEQGMIFTPFWRATNASAMMPDASGVGLAIAKYFVAQHGGTIGFKSQEGKGSTFWFEIPLV